MADKPEKTYLQSDTWVEYKDNGDIVLSVQQDQYILDRIPLNEEQVAGLVVYIQDVLLYRERAGEGQKIDAENEK